MTDLPLPSPPRTPDPAQLLLGAAEGVPLVPVQTIGPDATPVVIAVREPPVCGEWSYDDRELEEPGGTVLTAVTRPWAVAAQTVAPVAPPVDLPIVAAETIADPTSAPEPAPLVAPPLPVARPVVPPPSDPFTLLCERIETLATALRYAEASTALREAEALWPGAPELALLTGILACRRARWREAVAPLRSAAERLPDHAGAHYHLGEALNRCDDLTGALEAYRRAVALDPTNWRALKGVGIVYDRLGQPEQAAPYYRRARDAQRA